MKRGLNVLEAEATSEIAGGASRDTVAVDSTAGQAESGSGHSEQRRRELADFLRTRREKLKPEQVGIMQGARRRTPGLRREEVAELAGVGTTWYTWLEQARDIQPSSEVLRRLGQALKLQPAEVRHIFLLAGKSLSIEIGDEKEMVDPSILRFLHDALNVPAVVLGARWDVLAFNKAAEKAFPGLLEKPEGQRNWLDLIFCWPPSRGRVRNWETVARRVIAEFRSSLSESLDNPWVLELVDRMKLESVEFAQWWRDHDVRDNYPAIVELGEVRSEGVRWERAVLHPGNNPRQRILIFNPFPIENAQDKPKGS